jgi:hypothetical protein
MVMRTIRRKTMVELKQAIYDAHGWRRKPGESMATRIKPLYDVYVDHNKGDIVAVPKPKKN